MACDFVTIPSASICLELREQFRAERREDVLQLQTMLWYSWLSAKAVESGQPTEPIEPITQIKEFNSPMVCSSTYEPHHLFG